MTRERWLPIEGYEGRYEVSDHGRVRSLERVDTLGRTVKAHTLTPTTPTAVTYSRVGLWFDGESVTHTIHRLVATAFRDRAPGQPVVRHLDGTRTNNHYSNLAWGTHTDNAQDALLHGAHPSTKQTHCRRGHALDGPNGERKGNHRVCLSCRRAHGYRALHPEIDVQAYADLKYQEVLALSG